MSKITLTKTDQSPGLSSLSFVPIMAHFLNAANVEMDHIDISLAGRILQVFPEYLAEDQKRENDMDRLAVLVQEKDANVIKLPNSSATTNQLLEAIKELQAAGFAIPDYPENPANDTEREVKEKYDAATGSVVNPVLRQGNAVRSIPSVIKNAARRNPHPMGTWRKNSQTDIAHMEDGDFYSSEDSFTAQKNEAGSARIEFVSSGAKRTILKDNVVIKASDVIDTAVMSRSKLNEFLQDVMAESKDTDTLLSLHLKATMMKKTDGVFFGDAFSLYFDDVLTKHDDVLSALDIDPQNGLSGLKSKIEELDTAKKQEIERDIEECLKNNAPLAMANAKEGTTHLESPNLVIIDVSMANLARWGGQLQDAKGDYRDTLAVIPDSTYARMHKAGIEYLKQNGAPDPATMGTVKTIRLQAGGAEEYGSKATTFIAEEAGEINLIAEDGTYLSSQKVEKGDIWRLCRTNDDAVDNWIGLAFEHAKNTKDPVVFWLDEARPHDAEIAKKVKEYMLRHGVRPSNVSIQSPEDAIVYTLERSMNGQDTISVTGNLLGDHVTDYFPIMEIASSSKMLSVINLLNGGLVAETGSGGTAPDLLDRMEEQNHLLWDDVGTYLAFSESLKHLSETCQNAKALLLADTLDKAVERYVSDNRSPSPEGLDARESHFYLSLYWAEELARQSEDAELKTAFSELSSDLAQNKDDILKELAQAKGQRTDLKERLYPDPDKAEQIMRPSPTLNRLFA